MKFILHKQIGAKSDIVKEIKLSKGLTTKEALDLYNCIKLNTEYYLDDFTYILLDFYEHSRILDSFETYREEPISDSQIKEAKTFYETLSERHKGYVDVLISINSVFGPTG